MAVQSHGHATRARVWGAAIALLSPPMQAVALFMTIDGPMLACWAVAMWMAVRVFGDACSARCSGGGVWIGLGMAIGVGVLFKPTIAVLVPVLAVMLFIRTRGRKGGMAVALQSHANSATREEACLCRATSMPPLWSVLALVLAVSGFMPIVAWNLAHGWPMTAHLGEHLAAGESRGLARQLAWIGEYVSVQVILGGVALVAAAMGVRAGRRGGEHTLDPSGVRVCLACAGAVYLLYLAVACFTRVEGNWALGGLIPLLGIAGAWLGTAGRGNIAGCHRFAAARSRATGASGPESRDCTIAPVAPPSPHGEAPAADQWHPSRSARRLARAAVVVGLVTGLGMLRLDLIGRLPVVGEVVPVDRLTAGPSLARGVRESMTAHGLTPEAEPFIITDHYGRAALLEFYLNRPGTTEQESSPPRHIRIACASHTLGGRLTHFDLWPAYRLDDPALLGRPALLLGGGAERWQPLFGRIEAIEPIRGDHKRRGAFVGWAYRGVPASEGGIPEGVR